MRAVFVYPNPRGDLVEEVRAGRAPDTGLLGQNHLPALGIETAVHEPALRRKQRRGGVLHRLTWNARELALPWELGDAEIACTPLPNLFPLAARVRRRPRVLLLDYGLATLWRRASPLRRRLLRASATSSAAVVSLAEAQREDVLAQLGVPAARARVAHLGVDERFFAPAPPPADGYVLAVGKDLARDYATLARAAATLDARVVIVADPRNVAGVDLPTNVEVRQGLSWPELRDAYAGAACVVLPLRAPGYPFGTDGSGLTALVEAMAMGKAVVVTDRPVFADYVHAGESAEFVPPEDPAALRETLAGILGDAARRERMGTAVRRAVEARLTTRHFAERLAAIMRDVGA